MPTVEKPGSALWNTDAENFKAKVPGPNRESNKQKEKVSPVKLYGDLLSSWAVLDRVRYSSQGAERERIRSQLDQISQQLDKLLEQYPDIEAELLDPIETENNVRDQSEDEIEFPDASDLFEGLDGEGDEADFDEPADEEALPERQSSPEESPLVEQERRGNLATFQVVIEDRPSDTAERLQLTERAQTVEDLFTEKAASLPKHVTLTDGEKVLSYFSRQSADQSGKPFIPAQYTEDAKVKDSIDEAIRVLQGQERSLKEFIETATYNRVHGNEEEQVKASKQLVGAKILATYLLETNLANGGKEMWGMLTEDQKIKTRLAERMLNEIALATLSRQSEIPPSTAKAHAKVFKQYAKTFDINKSFKNRLLNEAARLQEKYTTPESAQAEAIKHIVSEPQTEAAIATEAEGLPEAPAQEPAVESEYELMPEDESTPEPAPSEPESGHTATNAVDEELKMEKMRDIDNYLEGKSDNFAYDEQQVLAALAENKHSDKEREARRQRYLDIWENELRASHAPDSLLSRLTSKPLERFYAQANVAPGLQRFLPVRLNQTGWQELRQGNWRKFRPFKVNRESWKEVIQARADVITSLRRAQAPNAEVQACMQVLADRLENMNRNEIVHFNQSWWQRLTSGNSSSATQS